MRFNKIKNWQEEFIIEAVKWVTQNGYSVNNIAQRLWVHPNSLRSWIKRLESPKAQVKHQAEQSSNVEIKRLQKELTGTYKVWKMCKVLKVHPSGYYEWLKQPISNKELGNQELLVHIKEAYKESNGIYGHRNIHKDLKELGIHVNKKRDAKLFGVGISKK